MWWTSFDGKKIQGWMLHPPDFDRTRKYPFILQIHGGPHSAYGNTFTHEFHWMAAKGYVVLCSPILAAAATTGRTLATSSNSDIRATTTRT